MTTIVSGSRWLIAGLFFSVFIMTSISAWCESDQGIEKLEIAFRESGGFAGVVRTSITIKPDGTVINDKNTSLKIQLSEREYEEVLSHAEVLMLKDIQIIERCHMSDTFIKRLSIKNITGSEKVIEVGRSCELIEPEDARTHAHSIFTLLKAIANRIEQ